MSKILNTHRAKLFMQVGNGVRSPRGAHDELVDLFNDLQTVKTASEMWFDSNGIKLTRPVDRAASNMGSRESQPDLVRITRSQYSHGLDSQSREALFDAMPPRAKAYRVGQVALRKGEGGYINQRQPFLFGNKLQGVYGYIDPKTDAFIPMLTRLHDQHPARVLEE